MSVPRSVGQVPVYYNKKAPVNHDYVEESARPLYAFGYGLSYTTFKYSDLKIESIAPQQVKLSFTVTNTGLYDGEEVAQLYLHDEYASVAQPLMQLKRFERFFLRKGESRNISFVLQSDDFAFTNRQYQRVVEPGTFKLMVGAASDDIRLEGSVVL